MDNVNNVEEGKKKRFALKTLKKPQYIFDMYCGFYYYVCSKKVKRVFTA